MIFNLVHFGMCIAFTSYNKEVDYEEEPMPRAGSDSHLDNHILRSAITGHNRHGQGARNGQSWMFFWFCA